MRNYFNAVVGEPWVIPPPSLALEHTIVDTTYFTGAKFLLWHPLDEYLYVQGGTKISAWHRTGPTSYTSYVDSDTPYAPELDCKPFFLSGNGGGTSFLLLCTTTVGRVYEHKITAHPRLDGTTQNQTVWDMRDYCQRVSPEPVANRAGSAGMGHYLKPRTGYLDYYGRVYDDVLYAYVTSAAGSYGHAGNILNTGRSENARASSTDQFSIAVGQDKLVLGGTTSTIYERDTYTLSANAGGLAIHHTLDLDVVFVALPSTNTIQAFEESSNTIVSLGTLTDATDLGGCVAMDFYENLMFVAAETGGASGYGCITIVDITDPAAMVIIDSIELPEDCNIKDVSCHRNGERIVATIDGTREKLYVYKF